MFPRLLQLSKDIRVAGLFPHTKRWT